MNKKCYICVDKTNDYHRLQSIANLFSVKPVFRCVVARLRAFIFYHGFYCKEQMD